MTEGLSEESTELMYPVIPLRNIVLLPGIFSTLFIGRPMTMRALQVSEGYDRKVVLLTQRDPDVDDPDFSELYQVGTVGKITQDLTLSDGTVKILVESLYRVRVSHFEMGGKDGCAMAQVYELTDEESDEDTLRSLVRTILPDFLKYARISKKISSESIEALQHNVDNYSKFADLVLHSLLPKIEEKQALLEMSSLSERLESLCVMLQQEIKMVSVENKIRQRVRKQMEKSQHEYYLNEQIKAIQKELGDNDGEGDEIEKREKEFAGMKLSKEAREKVASELKKFKSMGTMSAEASVVRNYLDWLASIPWKKFTRMKSDMKKARECLDAQHYGTDKVKARILEYLAVQKRLSSNKSPIICLVGPPGVGKTSLGSLMAEATGRSFVRVSLGGVRDEAEIRGHRRTYVGAMPGKIIQGMKKAGSSNPLFLLDEIDKLGADWRGDPASALLEILDPEQNKAFNDHYLEVDYDLSNVMFVTTANSTNIPRPLLDRMEVIQMSGYTEVDKIEIAKRHTISKVMAENGLKEVEMEVTNGALKKIIREYTRESGVRNLERQLSQLARKLVWEMEEKGVNFVKGKKVSVGNGKGSKRDTKVDNRITATRLRKMLGVPPFRFGRGKILDTVGLSTGLAWTEVGGDILSIESVAIPGKGRVTKTGKLGEIMVESIEVSEHLVKSRAASFGISPRMLADNDIHLHVPEGAVPKDGPSAGVAIVTSIVSLLTGIAVKHDVAMTGEITLQGKVLPIGGLKEKLLAAQQYGISTVIIPKENVRNLDDVPDKIKAPLNIVPVEDIDQVLKEALICEVRPVVWSDEEIQEAFYPAKKNQKKESDSGKMRH